MRIDVGSFFTLCVERGQWYGRAASRRHTSEYVRDSRPKDDHAVRVPRAPARNRRVEQRLRRTARGLILFELTCREKPYEATVRRPEGGISSRFIQLLTVDAQAGIVDGYGTVR